MILKALRESIIVVFFWNVLVKGEDILQYYRPTPGLPKELNQWLETVQNHKNDFRLIRDAVEFRKKENLDLIEEGRAKNNAKREFHYLFDEAEDNEDYDSLNDQPRNDIYPYMYKTRDSKESEKPKTQMNTHKDIGTDNFKSRIKRHFISEKNQVNEDDIEVELNGKNGEIQRAKDKYPQRFKGDVEKRDLQIDVMSDGKLVKQIKDSDRDAKSIVLNIQHDESTVSVPRQNFVGFEEQNRGRNQDYPETFKGLPPRSSNADNKEEIINNYKNLFNANEHLVTDSGVGHGELLKNPIVYHVSLPDIEAFLKTTSEEVPVADNQKSQSDTNKINYNHNGLQDMSNFWSATEKQLMQKGIDFARNIATLPQNTKSSQNSVDKDGFEQVQSIVVDDNVENRPRPSGMSLAVNDELSRLENYSSEDKRHILAALSRSAGAPKPEIDGNSAIFRSDNNAPLSPVQIMFDTKSPNDKRDMVIRTNDGNVDPANENVLRIESDRQFQESDDRRGMFSKMSDENFNSDAFPKTNEESPYANFYVNHLDQTYNRLNSDQTTSSDLANNKIYMPLTNDQTNIKMNNDQTLGNDQASNKLYMSVNSDQANNKMNNDQALSNDQATNKVYMLLNSDNKMNNDQPMSNDQANNKVFMSMNSDQTNNKMNNDQTMNNDQINNKAYMALNSDQTNNKAYLPINYDNNPEDKKQSGVVDIDFGTYKNKNGEGGDADRKEYGTIEVKLNNADVDTKSGALLVGTAGEVARINNLDMRLHEKRQLTGSKSRNINTKVNYRTKHFKRELELSGAKIEEVSCDPLKIDKPTEEDHKLVQITCGGEKTEAPECLPMDTQRTPVEVLVDYPDITTEAAMLFFEITTQIESAEDLGLPPPTDEPLDQNVDHPWEETRLGDPEKETMEVIQQPFAQTNIIEEDATCEPFSLATEEETVGIPVQNYEDHGEDYPENAYVVVVRPENDYSDAEKNDMRQGSKPAGPPRIKQIKSRIEEHKLVTRVETITVVDQPEYEDGGRQSEQNVRFRKKQVNVNGVNPEVFHKSVRIIARPLSKLKMQRRKYAPFNKKIVEVVADDKSKNRMKMGHRKSSNAKTQNRLDENVGSELDDGNAAMKKMRHIHRMRKQNKKRKNDGFRGIKGFIGNEKSFVDMPNKDSDSVPAFMGRQLKSMDYVYDVNIDPPTLEESLAQIKREMAHTKRSVTSEGTVRAEAEDKSDAEIEPLSKDVHKNSVEGDYGDEEDSSPDKQKKNEKLVKKTDNEFANPATTTDSEAEDMYYYEYENEYKNKSAQKDKNADYKNEKDNTAGFGKKAHKTESTSDGYGKRTKDNEEKKDKKKQNKKFSEKRRQERSFPSQTFLESSEFQNWPGFVRNDRQNEEVLRKRSLALKKKHLKRNYFPLSTKNFFLSPKKEFVFKDEKLVNRDVPVEGQTTEKHVDTLTLAEFNYNPNDNKINLNSTLITGDNKLLDLNVRIVDPDVCKDNNTNLPGIGNGTVLKNSPSTTTMEPCTDEGPKVEVTDICEDNERGLSQTVVDVRTVLPIVPDAESVTSMSYGPLERVDEVLNGNIPLMIVDSALCNIKDNKNWNMRFKHALRKTHTAESFASIRETSEEESRKIVREMSNLINKLTITTNCETLPPKLRHYLGLITKVKTDTVLARAKEMEGMPLDENQNQGEMKPYLFESAARVDNLEDKVSVLKGLLHRFHNLPDQCKPRALPVKEYIENHLGMLNNMLSGDDANPASGNIEVHRQAVETRADTKEHERAKHKMPDEVTVAKIEVTTESNLVEQQLDSLGLGKNKNFKPKFDLDELIKNNRHRKSIFEDQTRTKAPKQHFKRESDAMSKQYQKLQNAVVKERLKKFREKRLGQMYGKLDDDDFDDSGRSKREVKANFETPLVYSI